MAVLPAEYFVIVVTMGALLIAVMSFCVYTIWCCKCCECPDGTEYPEMNAIPGRAGKESKTYPTTFYKNLPAPDKSEQIV